MFSLQNERAGHRSFGGEGSRLILAAGAPDEVDEIIVHPLAGAPGRLLEDALEAAGLIRSDVFHHKRGLLPTSCRAILFVCRD